MLFVRFPFKIVLPFSLRSFPVLDGVHRAMVVTSHTHRAVSVPFRMAVFERDVLQRTGIGTSPALDTLFGEPIFAVVGGKLVETTVDDMALQPCGLADIHLRETLLVNQPEEVSFHLDVGSFDLLSGVFLGVKLETGHPNVGLGHFRAEAGRQRPVLFFQGFTEDVFRLAAFIAAGASKIDVIGLGGQLKLFHKVEHQSRWGPGIDGKHEAKSLIVSQRIIIAVFACRFGNEDQGIVEALGQGFGYMATVSATREIVYHRRCFFYKIPNTKILFFWI